MIRSFHFATALATDAEAVHWFCTEVLGLALVKRTVADDDPTVARLMYGAPDGRPGTLLNFFVATGFM
ncbi:MAG: ring-cleaving dioxygenase, partial [Armatimonadaceae bacterium]